MSKVRVLHFGSASGLYGAERWILALINNLDPTEVDSFVGSIGETDNKEPPLCVSANLLNVKTRPFYSRKRFDLSVIKDIAKFISDNDIQILHTHGYKTDFVGLLSTMCNGCKIITTPHGWTSKPDPKLFVYEAVDRLLFPFFDAIVPLSAELMNGLNWLPFTKSKNMLIVNGVDTKEIEQIHSVAEDIDKWRKENAFIIGYIGRLTSGKGLETLIDAVAKHRHPHWRVAIVGEGEQEIALKEKVNLLGLGEIFHFYGFREDRLELLSGFDVFCLPSKSEGIPRCLMEAMASRVPIIASDIPGCRHLVDGVNTGLLFGVGDVSELGAVLNRLDQDHDLRNKLASSAFDYVYKVYSAKRMADEYTKLYRSLICN